MPVDEWGGWETAARRFALGCRQWAVKATGRSAIWAGGRVGEWCVWEGRRPDGVDACTLMPSDSQLVTLRPQSVLPDLLPRPRPAANAVYGFTGTEVSPLQNVIVGDACLVRLCRVCRFVLGFG